MSSDEILEYLVKKAEETGIGIAVQLCINGLIVTGSLISPNRYYDLMHSIFDHNKEVLTDDTLEIKEAKRLKLILIEFFLYIDFESKCLKSRARKREMFGLSG